MVKWVVGTAERGSAIKQTKFTLAKQAGVSPPCYQEGQDGGVARTVTALVLALLQVRLREATTTPSSAHLKAWAKSFSESSGLIKRVRVPAAPHVSPKCKEAFPGSDGSERKTSSLNSKNI